MKLLSLGGFLFHCLVVKCKPWHQHTERCWGNWRIAWNFTNFMSNTIICLLLNSDEGLSCWDFLTLFMKSMKTCTTSVVCVVLPLHHRQEPGFQALEPPTLEMLSLLTMLKSSWGRASTWCCLFLMVHQTYFGARHNPHWTTKRLFKL